MAKLIEFKAPVQDRKSGEVTTEIKTGFIALFYIGNVQEKFILQNGYSGEADTLTHYASGMKLGDLRPYQIRGRTSPRRAAEIMIARLVACNGADKVRATLNAATTINA